MEQHPVYALVNLSILDVDRGELNGPAAIVVDNGRISDIRPGFTSDEGLPETRYDCTGLIALPTQDNARADADPDQGKRTDGDTEAIVGKPGHWPPP